jgi:tetratricopeptide (TPR) repeat protein
MIDALALGPAWEAGKWILGQLAGADGDTSVAENAGKIAGSLAMSCLGDAASVRLRGVIETRELRPASEPLNHYIEQAYRLAELGALVLFIKKLRDSGRLQGDAYTGITGELAVNTLSTSHRAVRKDRRSAHAAGIQLDHLATTLSSLSANQWQKADAASQALRIQIEDRALEELNYVTNVPPSPDFVAAFRSGLKDEPPAWFGLLAHNFVHVLLHKDMRQAQESLMLRMVARMASSTLPQIDLDALEQRLKALWPQGNAIEQRFATLINQLGDGMGSRLEEVRSEIEKLGADLLSFGKAWAEGVADLHSKLQRLEDLVLIQSAKLDEMLSILHALSAQRSGVPPRIMAPTAHTDWTSADLPRLPPPAARPVGRDKEVAAIESFLNNGYLTLLRISGRGGSGKTTVLAQSLLAQTAKPVIYQRATEVHRLTMAALLEAFDRVLFQMGGAPVTADIRRPTLDAKLTHVFEQLASHKVRPIVVLDSLEFAIEQSSGRLADADLEQFVLRCLGQSQPVQLIICSQQMPLVDHEGKTVALLAANFERQQEVSLGVGVSDIAACVGLLSAEIAVPRPDLDTADKATLAALCVAVGGNPMAIKHIAIALACDRLSTPEGLLRSLQTPRQDEPSANQVRHALIGRYFTQLGEPEQRLLRALAMLGGSAKPTTIVAVAQIASPGAEAALLNSLLKRDLLSQARDTTLSIHDSEKAYYLSTVPQDTLREGYLRGAEFFRRESLPPARWSIYADADAALREASLLDLAGEKAHAAVARVRAARRLSEIGHVIGALHVLALEAIDEQAGAADIPRIALLAACHWKVGAYATAQAECERGLALAATCALEPTHADVLSMRQIHATCQLELGHALLSVDDCRQLVDELARIDAADSGTDAAACARRKLLRARTLIDLAFAESVAGQQRDALCHAQGALEVLRAAPAEDSSNDDRRACAVLAKAYVGLVHTYLGDFSSARGVYVEAIRAAVRQPGLYERAIALGHLAELELIEGRFDLAIDLATKALQAEAETDAMSGSWCNWLVAMALAFDPDRIEVAEQHARRACQFTRLLNDPNPRALLGLLLLRRGKRAEAVEQLEQAREVAESLIDACATNWEALVARGLALLALATLGRAKVEEALADYGAAHAASPHVGHLARITLQLQIAAPILQPAGIDVAADIDLIYGRGGPGAATA